MASSTSSTSYAPPNIFPKPPIDEAPPGNPGGHRLVSHCLLSLIVDVVDEKTSNANSDSMFQVLRYHTGQLTLYGYPV
jgi:hypothetical protein